MVSPSLGNHENSQHLQLLCSMLITFPLSIMTTSPQGIAFLSRPKILRSRAPPQWIRVLFVALVWLAETHRRRRTAAASVLRSESWPRRRVPPVSWKSAKRAYTYKARRARQEFERAAAQRMYTGTHMCARAPRLLVTQSDSHHRSVMTPARINNSDKL